MNTGKKIIWNPRDRSTQARALREIDKQLIVLSICMHGIKHKPYWCKTETERKLDKLLEQRYAKQTEEG